MTYGGILLAWSSLLWKGLVVVPCPAGKTVSIGEVGIILNLNTANIIVGKSLYLM